jgi:hypothetical protein
VNEASDDEEYAARPVKCHAHMDDIEEVQPRVYKDRYGERREETSNFWLRQLDAAESSDPNRSTLIDCKLVKLYLLYSFGMCRNQKSVQFRFSKT